MRSPLIKVALDYFKITLNINFLTMNKNNNINPFKQFNKNPLDTTKENADPLGLAIKADPISILPQTPMLEALKQIQSILPQGTQFQLIPSGSKGIVIRQELSLELRNRIEELKKEIAPFKEMVFKTQEDVVNANAVLKKTKKIETSVKEDRKVITSPLKDETDSMIRYEEKVIGDLQADTKFVNDRIITFQVAEQRKADELAKKIEAEKQAELEKVRVEAARVSKIKQSIIDFETYALREIHSATIGDIDEKIKRVNAVKLNPEHYEEFLSEAQIMYQNCVTKFNERKVELMKLAQAELTNKQAADNLRLQQEEKAKIENAQLLQRSENVKNEIAEATQNEVSNIQMTSEFKDAQIEQAKGVVKRWGFNESTIDMSLLPEKYKIPDLKKIKEDIAAGARNGDIPGVIISQTITNSSR